MTSEKDLKAFKTLLNLNGGCPCSCGQNHLVTNVVPLKKYGNKFLLLECENKDGNEMAVYVYDAKKQDFIRSMSGHPHKGVYNLKTYCRKEALEPWFEMMTHAKG